MTTFGDMVYQLGGVPVGSGLGSIGLAGGDVFFVNAADGLAANSGKNPSEGMKTLKQGYDKTADSNNDVVILVGDSSGAQLDASTSTGLTWSNSYTHLIGACAPTFTNKRARLFHNFNASPIWTISGSGNTFENFYFSHGRGSTDNKIGINVTGGRLYFGNVHIAGPQNTTDGNQTTYSCVTLASGSEDITFDRCVLGHDTAARGNGATSLTLSGVTHLLVKDTVFLAQSSNAGATHVEIAATGIATGYAIFDDCKFLNSGTTLTQAIDSNIVDTTAKKVLLSGNTFSVGATDIADATGDGTIWFRPDTATANVALLGTNVAVT